MANVYKVLGQVGDASLNDVSLYAVPASTEAVISTIVICNREAAANTFRVAVKPDNATLADSHYLAYDSTINANDTITLTLGITLGDTDVISVGASDANVTFNVFGTEIS